MMTAMTPSTAASLELWWIPLGAGGTVVRWNGKAYEALVAARDRRPRCDLYHAALQAFTPEGHVVVEVTPIPDAGGRDRGVVAEGPVGVRALGRLRLFRYEVRRWRDGVIPDLAEAVGAPTAVASDLETVERFLDVLASVPTPVWGRDELGTGDMWNSNSVISWALTRAGVEADRHGPPPGGRAPGWRAGIAVARRMEAAG
jgi:hypothetical protein